MDWRDDLEASIAFDAAFDDSWEHDPWKVCRECDGTGWIEDYDFSEYREYCTTCNGDGYVLREESSEFN